MTLFFYISPNSLFSGGVDLGATGVRLGQMSGWSQIADQGQAAFSEITFDDPTGALAVTGLRPFWVEDTAASPSRVWTGYVTSRKYARDKDRSQIVGAARTTTVSFVDINAILDLRVIKNVDGKRPAETDLQRLAWLISTYYLPVYDNGQVATTNGRPMSAADYRGQYAHDVLNDCAQESGRNYFIYWDPTAASGHELSIYYNALGSTVGFTSTLFLTNTNSAVNNTTVFPAKMELNRDPQDVYSGVYMNYDGGHVYHSRPSTATTFIWREAVADAGHTKSRTVAGVRAERFLNNSDTEKDTIEATVQLPKDKVNLIDIGRGLRVHADHLPGYTSGYTELQVAARQVNQSLENPDYYQVDLHLAIPKILGGASGPGSGAPFVEDCGTGVIVQSANGYDVIGNPYTVTLGGTPADGNILVAFASFGGDGTGGTMADVLTLGGSWTKGPTIEGYDVTQFGGPGGAVRMSAYYRTWTTGDPVGYLVTPNTAHSGVVIYEVAGVSGATISSGSVTNTMTAGNAYSVSATGSGFIIGGWAHQRTSYAPQDSYTTSAGTELWDYDETKGVAGGDAPWVYLGYNNGTNPAVTGTPAANPNLNKWARAAVWLFFDITDCSTPLVGQQVPFETAGTGDGSTALFTTNYPYQPGSLLVTVDGLVVIPTETSPTTGTFTLAETPLTGEIVNVTYQAADDTTTGAGNSTATASSSSPGLTLVNEDGTPVETRLRGGLMRLLVANDTTDKLLEEVLMELRAISVLLAEQ